MTNTKLLVGSAIAAVAALSAVTSVQAGPAEKPGYKFEKCYGVVKAGSNDCQTATHSCAGTAQADAQPDSWVYVPAGTCAKLVGGSTEAKS